MRRFDRSVSEPSANVGAAPSGRVTAARARAAPRADLPGGVNPFAALRALEALAAMDRPTRERTVAEARALRDLFAALCCCRDGALAYPSARKVAAAQGLPVERWPARFDGATFAALARLASVIAEAGDPGPATNGARPSEPVPAEAEE